MRRVIFLPVLFSLFGQAIHGKMEILPSTAKIVEGEYVVVVDPICTKYDRSTYEHIAKLIDGYGTIGTLYQTFFHGVSITNVTNAFAVGRVVNSSCVQSITPNYEFELDSIQTGPENWGLDRIDEEHLPLDGLYRHTHSGRDVDVYIVDTGIFQEHVDLISVTEEVPRVVECAWDALQGECEDRNGHGTAVASIIGGKRFGVAKNANLLSVKVCNQICSLDNFLAGIQAILDLATRSKNPPVVNIALSGPKSKLPLVAMDHLYNASIPVVVSAGNYGFSSCRLAPGASDRVITVSATTIEDGKPYYANDGLCNDVFAPGHEIVSAWNRDPFDTASLSGTSMAAAFVTGGAYAMMLCLTHNAVVAQYLERSPTWSPDDLLQAIHDNGMHGLIEDLDDSTLNLLLNTGDLRSPFD